jgi:hypothetical protein
VERWSDRVDNNERIALNLRRFREAVFAHERENPTHNAYGIGLAAFDLERLGFEEGEELWPGVRVEVDGKTAGNFRVLCDGDHKGQAVESWVRERAETVA